MKFNDNLPIYVQIIEYIKRKIITLELKGGDKLPSVRELSGELKVNPNTVQRSYQELEREDLVYTQRGMGTFVTEDEKILKELKNNMASSIVDTFVQEMKSLGFNLNEIENLIKNKEKEEF